ncbi:MAG: diguanylate cyclase, partial [Chloroflexota bacterium]
ADQFVLLTISLALIAAVAVAVAYATAHATRHGADGDSDDQRAPGLRGLTDEPVDPMARPAGATSRPRSMFVSPASTRQVARVVAFLFLASVAVVVALTRAWPDTEPAIFTLLAAGTLLVVIFMDMVPPAAMGSWRRPAEGVGAIVYLGLLMGLTGGVGSPFFVGFFLVVAGTALSTEGLAPLLVAVVAAATMAVVGVVASFDAALEPQGLAWIGFNAVALILLADVATAAARAQRKARDEALRASRFDALTGLYNRSFFFTTMEQEIRRSDRMGRGFTMLMLDLDDLKPVNDTFGHQWGDRLLKAIADVVRQTVRFTDSAARYGGDEFVVLLPETDVAGGFVVGEKLRRDIAALTLHAGERNVRSSVSVGLVSYPDDGTTIEQLVAAADVAMYESKRRGKNRIVGYQTRTERVATAIDIDSAELVQLGPAGDVRTGGDQAPWGPDPGTGASASQDEVPRAKTRPQTATGRRYDGPAGGPERAPGRQPGPGPGAESSQEPWEQEPRASRVEAPGAAPDPRSQPSTGTGTFLESPLDADPGASDAPWLTRTEVPRPPAAAPPSDAVPPSDAASQRPAADARSPSGKTSGGKTSGGKAPGSEASGGRPSSRSDEIRQTGERPWIALPIEPYEPPERPKG